MKFQKGDKVDSSIGGKNGVIKACYGPNIFGILEYLVEFDNNIEWVIFEQDLWFSDIVKKNTVGCECGAHKVRGLENFHSTWCPIKVKND